MYQKVKLSKRQIKEDKFTGFMLRTKGYFEDNWQYLAIAVVAVILVAVGLSYYGGTQDATADEASVRFSRALSAYRSGNNQTAQLGLSQILADYRGHAVAEQATFLLGKVSYQMRNYAEAMNYFQEYVAKYKTNHLLRAGCYAGMAACQEDQALFTEAAGHYQSAYDENPDGPMAGDYLMGAMRCNLQSGDVAAAKALVDQIESDFAGTNLATRATRYFAEYATGS